MRPSIRLGRIFGIEIGLHYSWFVVALLIVLSLAGQFHLINTRWPAHIRWLHGYFSNYVLERLDRSDLKKKGFAGPPGTIHHWDLYENGIIKRSRAPGVPETDGHWSEGVGFLFPNIEVVHTNVPYHMPSVWRRDTDDHADPSGYSAWSGGAK